MRIRTAFGPVLLGEKSYAWRAWVHQGDANAIGYGRTEAEAIGQLVLKRETPLDVHCISPPQGARIECSSCGQIGSHYNLNGHIHLGCRSGTGIYIYVKEEAPAP